MAAERAAANPGLICDRKLLDEVDLFDPDSGTRAGEGEGEAGAGAGARG